jgi:Spy/CpxP family protein refolding chaperone
MRASMNAVFLGLALALSAGAAQAQAPRRDRQALEERIRERVRALRTARLIEYLDLDEKTAQRLMPIVNRVYDEIGGLARDTGEARRELRDLVRDPSPDATRMALLADRIVANRQKMARLEADGIKQARAVLTPRQGAIYVLVLAEIDRGIERRIRKAARGPEEEDRVLPF